MNLLPFGKLAAHRARMFVPQDINLGDWPQIAPLFDQLEVLAARANSAAELERWLIDWSELNAALDEETSGLVGAPWSPSSGIKTTNGNVVQVSMPATNALKLFRLAR